jgi:nitrile hydratase accessory protein
LSEPDTAAFAGLGAPGEPPTFGEPWEAQAFALAVHLHAQGAFTWTDWTEALAQELSSRAQGADAGYACWVAALERLTTGRDLVSARTLVERKEAWAEAYRRTPHGKPVEL